MEAKNWGKYVAENYPWLAQKGAGINEKVDYSIEDEAKAGPEYRKLAQLLRDADLKDHAETIERIAMDEDRHLEMLKRVKEGLKSVERTAI